VRVATNVQKGQPVLVTEALGSVDREAVRVAKKIGATVIAGVRRKELDKARALGAPMCWQLMTMKRLRTSSQSNVSATACPSL
jgi:NADPH:quinone reductase-like Zn-dependent oxidoreductase